MNKLQKIAKFAIPAAMILIPLMTFGAVVNPPGVAVPPGTGLDLAKIQDLITTIANYLIVIGIVIAVVMIVWGGIRYMAARGDAAHVKAAQETIKNGIIGAVIVLAVGVILNTAAGLVTRTFFGAGQ
jgi:hypothetical protein